MLYDPKWEVQAEASRILNLAADLIERCGHAKYTLEDDAGQMCIGGAILKAATGKVALCDHTPALELACSKMHAQTDGYFVGWNNAAERTQAEVVAALREAALT
jgi:hypothetical protein